MIYTKTLEEHCTIVCEVLQILCDNKLYLKHEKCEFKTLETEYIGLIISQNAVIVRWTLLRSPSFVTGQPPCQRKTSVASLASSTSIVALLRISLNLPTCSMH